MTDGPGQGKKKENDLTTARLNSIATECNDLKDRYEQCFFDFFPRFLKGEKFRVDPCEAELRDYRECVRAHLVKKMGLDLGKLDTANMSAAELAESIAEKSAGACGKKK